MAKPETYVKIQIGYSDYLMPLDQAQAVQRALVGAIISSTCYQAKTERMYGSRQVPVRVDILDTPPLIVSVSEEVQMKNYITCLESAYKIDCEAPFPDYETWKKEVI